MADKTSALRAEAEAFLRRLWPETPEGLGVAIWASGQPVLVSDDLGRCAQHAVALSRDLDVYVGCTLRDRALSGGKRRGGATESLWARHVWADIDVKADCAPSIETAVEALKALPVPPTVIVTSGFGVHAYWVLVEPANLRDAVERARFVAALRGWLGFLRQTTGWALDSVGDMARVLRLPGTLNHKGAEPAAVRVLEDTGAEVDLSALEEWAAEDAAPPASAAAAHPAQVGDLPPGAELPDRLAAILETGAFSELERTLEESPQQRAQRTGGDASPSAADLAVGMTFAARVELTDDELVGVMRHYRARHGDEKGKLDRRDYWELTVGKVRALAGEDRAAAEGRRVKSEQKIAKAAATSEAEIEKSDAKAADAAVQTAVESAEEGLRRASEEAAPENGAGVEKAVETALATIRETSELPVARVSVRVLDRTQGVTARRVTLHLEDGRKIVCPRVGTLIQHSQFAARVAECIGSYPPPRKKAQWDPIVRLILQVAEEEEEEEGDDMVSAVLHVLLSGLARATAPLTEELLRTTAPGDLITADRDERVSYVEFAAVTDRLTKAKVQRVHQSNLGPVLRELGFSPVRLRRGSERRRLWRGPGFAELCRRSGKSAEGDSEDGSADRATLSIGGHAPS